MFGRGITLLLNEVEGGFTFRRTGLGIIPLLMTLLRKPHSQITEP